MRATIPFLVPVADQPEISLMHERGRLQGLARCFLGHPVRRKFAKFRVHQREQFVRGFGISCFY
jgi:hypothetical protein